MIKSLKIILWNEEIGRLAWDEHRRPGVEGIASWRSDIYKKRSEI